jgi:hypothetical protein
MIQLSLGVLMIFIMTSSTISGIAITNDNNKLVRDQSKQLVYSYEPEKRIGVIYAGNDLTVSGTAISLYESLRLVYKSIDLIYVGSLDDIKEIGISKYNILIYVFETSLEGAHIGDLVTWKEFADFINLHTDQHHVLGMGNANYLYRYIPVHHTNVWVEGHDILDAQLVYLWCIWAVADILETNHEQYSDYYNAGVNIRKLSLKYFADNINSIVERNFDIIDRMGEEDLVAKQKRYDEMEARFPKYIEPKFDIRDLPEENRPAMYIKKSTEETLDLGDIILGFLPIESGLQGPIGGIIDLLLDVFISMVGDDIVIGKDAMQQIELAFKVLETILGFFGGEDISVESALYDLFVLLEDMIPFADELKPFVKILLNAIPLLRGDWSAIVTIIGDLLDLLFKYLPGDLTFFKEILIGEQYGLLHLGASVVEQLQTEGGNFLDILMSVMSSKYIDGLLNKTLTETLGLSVSDFNQYFKGITAFFKSIMDFLARFDLKNTISTYLPQLIQFLFEVLGDTITTSQAEQWANGIGVVVKLIMSAIGYSDDNLASIFNEILQLFGLPTTEDLNNLIQRINTIISEAKENAEQLVTNFQTNIRNAITEFKSQTGFQFSTDSTKDQRIQEVIIAGATMVAGAINGDFTDKENLPNLNSTVELVLKVLELTLGDIDDNKEKKILKAVNNVVAIIAVISDKNEIKQYISSTIDKFKEQFENPVTLIQNTVTFLLSGASSLGIDETVIEKIKTFAEMGMGFFNIILAAKDNSIQGILQALIENVGLVLVKEFVGIDIDFVHKILQFIFPKFFGVETSELPSAHELISDLIGQLNSAIGDIELPSFAADLGLNTVSELISSIESILKIVFDAKDIFTDGLRWLFGQLMDWVGGQIEILINKLLEAITSALDASDLIPPEWAGSLPVGLGGFSLFEIGIELGLYPHFGFDADAFTDWILDIVFGGLNPFQGDDLVDYLGSFFKKIFSFFELIPTFKAGFELGGFGTEENPLMAFLLESLGLELEFSGKGWFELELFTIKGGVFDTDNFFKVIEWGFSFTITVSRTFTLLDFLTGGTAGALNAVGEYLGLDAITVTVSFGIFLEVVKRAASATGPEEGSFTLKITLGLAVHFGIDLFIVGISFDFSMEIILTFFQDLVNPVPLQIFLEIILRFSVTLTFLFADWEIEFEWKPLDPSPLELTSSDPEEMEENGAMGMDADSDGISDTDELSTPGLNPYSEDTDGDGLTDKFETQTSKTDPILPDSDGDGLDDFVEYHNTKTNPLQPDTDWDGLTDYEEAIIIGTNPLDTDTDEDGIDDFYEVNHAYDISKITPSVEYVMIGGVKYYDRTDPLNPDTDGDGLLDGEEGEFGPYYGLPMLRDNDTYNHNDPTDEDTETPYNLDSPVIIFNGGYTSPLDNDTDDDSWEQEMDGKISPSILHAWVKIKDGTYILTSDWWEVKGMPIVYMIEGEPVLNVTYTNPCNPDTDGDTGAKYFGYDRNNYINDTHKYDRDWMDPSLPHDPSLYGYFLNSDGYELSLDPPSDPCDADTDNDGLIDGIEGTLQPVSNHTHYANPDTDGDGLGDMQEMLLGSDPRHPDGDRDMVIDGDEYFKYGTHPANPDTDFDGLLDGEELYWYHTNPFSVDSDGDRIGDWMELMVYFTDPMDEDTDNDRLDDYEEKFIYRTKPNDPDTDSEEWNDLNHNFRYDGLEEWDPKYDENGNGVWDGDYIRDGDEVHGTYNGIKTDPLEWDTDLDSITYFVVYPGGKIDYTFRMSDGDELYDYGTNPTYGDTDLDGLTDGWEIYLGSGLVPDVVFEFYSIEFPILLDPLSNDTDGDTILDGVEMMIGNQSSLIYPYVGFFLVMPYNTSPVLLDSDFDFLNDSQELDDYHTRPDVVDTDNDTLSDYDEIFFHLTDPLQNDTDADGLLDCNETTAVVPVGWGSGKSTIHLMGPYSPVYPTFADDPDSDDDFLPDGAELDVNMCYLSDPMVPDSLIPGIKDGLLFDSDNDGISDGYEYFGDPNGTLSPTTMIAGGGPFNPDSDHDGLLDGFEWQVFGTNASNWDSDGDSFSDGLEYLVGTNASEFTNASEMYDELDIYRHDLVVTSPIDTTYETETITTTVANFTSFNALSYRFVHGPTSHAEVQMDYNKRQHQWESGSITLDKGSYTIEVTGTKPDDTNVVKRVSFRIQVEPVDVAPFLVGGVIGFSTVSFLLFLTTIIDLQKLLFWKREERGF